MYKAYYRTRVDEFNNLAEYAFIVMDDSDETVVEQKGKIDYARTKFKMESQSLIELARCCQQMGLEPITIYSEEGYVVHNVIHRKDLRFTQNVLREFDQLASWKIEKINKKRNLAVKVLPRKEIVAH